MSPAGAGMNPSVDKGVSGASDTLFCMMIRINVSRRSAPTSARTHALGNVLFMTTSDICFRIYYKGIIIRFRYREHPLVSIQAIISASAGLTARLSLSLRETRSADFERTQTGSFHCRYIRTSSPAAVIYPAALHCNLQDFSGNG